LPVSLHAGRCGGLRLEANVSGALARPPARPRRCELQCVAMPLRNTQSRPGEINNGAERFIATLRGAVLASRDL